MTLSLVLFLHALTPLRTVEMLCGTLAAVAAIVWFQRVHAGLTPEQARERLEAVRQDRRAPAILLRPFGFEQQDFSARSALDQPCGTLSLHGQALSPCLSGVAPR
jgi:hypothetical protein